MAQSKYFKRLKRECRKISPHIRFKRIRMGFYRIYQKNKYLHEAIEQMPVMGYDIEIDNPKVFDKEYYEEYEDNLDMIRKVKNFVEGYVDAKQTIERRMWMLRHDKEMNEHSEGVYNKAVFK